MNIQTLTDKIKNDDILNNLSAFFPNKIYLVGGSVRDAIMGKDYFDRDLIVIDSDAREFSLKVAEFFDGVFIICVWKTYKFDTLVISHIFYTTT